MNYFFYFDNCIVETVDNCNAFETKPEYGFLVISIILELKSYESLTDAAAFARPKYLNILGIVSFLVDEPEEEKIIFGGLNYFIVSKKIVVNQAKDIYEFYLETEIENKDFLATNIDAIVLLYESNIESIEEVLKKAIINTYKYDSTPHYKFRDMMYYLDYHNFKTPKLESLILNDEVS